MITNEQRIEEILSEANAYGRRKEVQQEAQRVMAYFIEMDDVDCYEMAFNRLITLDIKNNE